MTTSYEDSFASHPRSEFWHPTLNGSVTPRDIAKSNGKKHWFKCGVCNHDFDNIFYNIIHKDQWCSYCAKRRLCLVEDCVYCLNNSFASHEKSKFWHPTLNGALKPRTIFKNNTKKCWFKCGICKHDFDIVPNTIISKKVWCPYCAVKKELCNNQSCNFCINNSFASHEKSKFWHPTLNGSVTPRDITKSYRKKYWFKCGECNHEFDSTPSHINEGNWCPYCANKKRCDIGCTFCFNNSFASHEKSKFWHPTLNGSVTPRDIAKSSNIKYWFKCGDCNHNFDSVVSNVSSRGTWCPYCAICSATLCESIDCVFCFKKSFASHEKSKFWHPTLNDKITPRDMCNSSGKKFWFKCEYCNNDFKSVLRHITRGNGCPVCRNKTEKKLLEYLNSQYPDEVKFQLRFDWCKNSDTNKYLPFDFEIFKSIIVELDGPQHIDKQISNWKSPEEHQKRDIYKMRQAINNKKHIIRILQEDVFNDKCDWKEKLNSAITSLRVNNPSTKITCIGDCDIYREYTVTFNSTT
jgi:hypothetical protein